jgi:hypothetical protein
VHIEVTTIVCGDARLWNVELVAGATRVHQKLFQSENGGSESAAITCASDLARGFGLAIKMDVIDRDVH